MLTDIQARKARPAEKPFKLSDAGGLYLFVTPTGFKSWRLKYRFAAKEKTIVFGPYPEVTLIEAREARDVARKALRDGRDPATAKKQRAADTVAAFGNSFERVARDWHDLNKSKWSPIHAADVLDSLVRDVFPSLGKMPITELTVPLVLVTLRAIEKRPALETARRVRQRMSAVFVHGIASGICEADPAAVVRGVMAPLVKGRFPAIVDLAEAKSMLQAIESISAHPATRAGHRLLSLTGVRCAAIYGAAWDEFENLDGIEPIWRIPKERMKGRTGSKVELVVPLAPQSVGLIQVMRPLTGRGPLVFPNARHAHRPMSENALANLIERAGYKGRHVPHGWRSSFSTIMNERAERAGRGADRAIIDLMLAHVPENDVERAYNRAGFAPRKREIAEAWADILLEDAMPAEDLVVGRRR